jgi:NAD-dependent SIR2 family protein deacetylase
MIVALYQCNSCGVQPTYIFIDDFGSQKGVPKCVKCESIVVKEVVNGEEVNRSTIKAENTEK